jgi:hypothetical protein
MKKIGLLFFLISFINISAQNANHVVIAEVYGGGGNSGATLKNDYILLYNPTTSDVDVSTWSVQYASSSGTTWAVTSLTGSISSKSYYLIQEAQGTGGTVDLPTPNVIGTIAMSATNAKVALVSSTTTLSGATQHAAPTVVDYVGWGNATDFEGSGAAPVTSNTTSVCRKGWDGAIAQNTYGESYGNGYDTNDNANDFYTRDPSLTTVMPVELTSFSASVIGNTVKLIWKTATEVNNYGFEILRQAQDDKDWTKIGFVNGNGNSNSPKSYSFTDRDVNTGKYNYRLKQMDNDGTFEYSKTVEADFGVPTKFELNQNFPNPFNPTTTISYDLPDAANVKLTIFNILGQEIKILVDGFREAGVHTITFDADDLDSGLYIYKLQAGSQVQTKKMTLIK